MTNYSNSQVEFHLYDINNEYVKNEMTSTTTLFFCTKYSNILACNDSYFMLNSALHYCVFTEGEKCNTCFINVTQTTTRWMKVRWL